jgi:hypothetical protein
LAAKELLELLVLQEHKELRGLLETLVLRELKGCKVFRD